LGCLIKFIDDEKFKPKAAEYESMEEYRMAMRTLTSISNDEKQQINYLSYLINEMDYESNKSALEEKGRLEGRQEGLLEGRQQGLHEGEQKAKLNSARRMLLRGLSPADVAQFTDLPIDTIRAIQNKT
jgi:predicted transposase/invertase (TIGR01784 family)